LNSLLNVNGIQKKWTVEDKTMGILFTLMRAVTNDYTYGLQEKIQKGVPLKDDLVWLINDCIEKNNRMFYETARTILSRPIVNSLGEFNLTFIDQDEYKGLHRAGWSYVIDHLRRYNSERKIPCDLYVDRTFHWNAVKFAKLKIIPYVTPWVGFIHHTFEKEHSENNTGRLFTHPDFIASLPHCKGLFVLSEHLKREIESRAYPGCPPVYALTHPTEFPSVKFSMTKFLSNPERKIIQVGAWMRNLNAINTLDLGENGLKLCKTALKGKKMTGYYAEPTTDQKKAPSDVPVMSRDIVTSASGCESDYLFRK
jgi:hypothetical protein